MYKIKHLDNQITHCHVTSRKWSRPIHKVHVATRDWSRSSENNGKSLVQPLHSMHLDLAFLTTQLQALPKAILHDRTLLNRMTEEHAIQMKKSSTAGTLISTC